MFRHRMRVGCAVFLLAYAACSSLGNAVAQENSWRGEPKADDDIWMYRAGEGHGKTVQEAKDKAYESALGGIVKSIQSEVKVRAGKTEITSTLVVRNAEIMPQCVYVEQSWGRYRCLLQVAYPILDKTKILKRIALGDELNKDWNNAFTAFQRKDYASALSLAQKILGLLEGDPLGIGFTRSDVLKMLEECGPKCETVAIFTACKIGEGTVVWDPPRSDIASLVNEGGRRVIVVKEDDHWRPGRIVEAVADDAGCVRLAGQVPATFVILFALQGTIETRPNAKAVHGKDFRFEGMARIAVVKGGTVAYCSRYSLASGWNSVSEKVCLDVVGGHVLARWKEEFVEKIWGAKPMLLSPGEER